MAYVKVPVVTPGQTWTHTNHNTYIRDNMEAIADDALNPAVRKLFEFVITEDAPEFIIGDIPQDYKHLELKMRGRIRIPSATGGGVTFRFNGDSGLNYYNQTIFATGSGVGTGIAESIGINRTGVATLPSDNAGVNYSGLSNIFIAGYSSSILGKVGFVELGFKEQSGSLTVWSRSFYWNSQTPVTQINVFGDIYPDVRFLPGTLFSLYGYL